MSKSAAFIVSLPTGPDGENLFYRIKKFIEQQQDSRLIYCTRGEKRLYVTTEEGME